MFVIQICKNKKMKVEEYTSINIYLDKSIKFGNVYKIDLINTNIN